MLPERAAEHSFFLGSLGLARPLGSLGSRLRLSCHVTRPIPHELTPFLEEVRPQIRGLGLIIVHVRQCQLADLARIVGFLAGPAAKAGPETMHCHVAVAHAVQQHEHGAIAQMLTLVAGECPIRVRMFLPYCPQDFDRSIRWRNAMLPLALDAAGWDGPNLAV